MSANSRQNISRNPHAEHNTLSIPWYLYFCLPPPLTLSHVSAWKTHFCRQEQPINSICDPTGETAITVNIYWQSVQL